VVTPKETLVSIRWESALCKTTSLADSKAISRKCWRAIKSTTFLRSAIQVRGHIGGGFFHPNPKRGTCARDDKWMQRMLFARVHAVLRPTSFFLISRFWLSGHILIGCLSLSLSAGVMHSAADLIWYIKSYGSFCVILSAPLPMARQPNGNSESRRAVPLKGEFINFAAATRKTNIIIPEANSHYIQNLLPFHVMYQWRMDQSNLLLMNSAHSNIKLSIYLKDKHRRHHFKYSSLMQVETSTLLTWV
jgi:hypothetical protein